MASAALGVNCSYCHSGVNFPSEAVPMKQVARKMFAMTLELNEKHFDGKPVITCATCHAGRKIPQNGIDLSAKVAKAFESPTSKSLQTPEEILDRYTKALGGKDVLQQAAERKIVGERVEPNGTREPEELLQSRTGLSSMKTVYGKTEILEGYDGKSVWKGFNQTNVELKEDEADQIRREAILASGLDVGSSYTDLYVVSDDRINDRPVQVLEGKSFGKWNEQLAFDSETGLLSRRICSIPTQFGDFQYQVDYTQYRSFDGMQQPTRIRFAVPNIHWTREVKTIEVRKTFSDTTYNRP